MIEELKKLLELYASEDTNSFSGFARIDVNTAGYENVTPLHMACTRAALRDVELLLGGGANVNARTDIGHTPLHGAVCSRNPAIVRLLLAAGANPDACSNFGETPISMSIALGLSEIQRLLQDAKGGKIRGTSDS